MSDGAYPAHRKECLFGGRFFRKQLGKLGEDGTRPHPGPSTLMQRCRYIAC